VAGFVAASTLLVLTAACGGPAVDDGHEDPPEVVGHSESELSAEEEEAEAAPRLNREQLERYYAAQVAWRGCATGEGIVLSEPPPREVFVAGGGAWWVGSELSEDEWNRMVGDESGTSGLGARCGEPPLASDFLVGHEALERLYAWQVQVVSCLEAEGFPLDGAVPPVAEFVRTGGANWVPATEFTARYGFPEGPAWHRVATRCGSPTQDLWLGAADFVVDRAALEEQYEANLALTACLEGAGFAAPDPPPFDDFVDQLGWNWTNAGIWAAVYRDNDRDAVLAFADSIDQRCPGVS
jgi:hypothetical protein